MVRDCEYGVKVGKTQVCRLECLPCVRVPICPKVQLAAKEVKDGGKTDVRKEHRNQ